MKDSKNIIGRNFGRGTGFAKEDLIKILDSMSREIAPGMVSYTKDLSKIVSNGDADATKLSSSIAFSSLSYANDVELLRDLSKIMSNYAKNISSLKDKIDEVLPDIIPVSSSNLNIKLAMSILNIGMYFAYDLPKLYSYLITRYYTDTKVDTEIYKSVSRQLPTLASLMKDLKKTDIGSIIKLIGSFPTMKNLSDRPDLPSNMMVGFLKSELGISSPLIANFVVKSMNLFKKDHRDYKRTNESLKNRAGEVGFIGNPIYHIRLILTDLEINKYERLKDNIRLLDLKLAYLKSKDRDDEKLNKQIEYYENKIEKMEMKLDTILSDSKTGRRTR